MKSGFYSMFQQLTGTIYMALGTNVLLIVLTAPLVACLLCWATSDARGTSWCSSAP